MDITIVSVEQSGYRKILQSKAEPVSFPLQEEDLRLIDAMKTKLHELGGVGLAAPQVNYAKQIIAIYIPEEAKLLRDEVESTYPMHIMINPSYEPTVPEQIYTDFEGCYSVSSKAGKVPRYETIEVRWFDEQGHSHKSIEQGFYARVLQHEIDHLNGILISDRLTPGCIQGTVEEMRDLRRAELSEEKRALYDQIMERKMRK